MLLGAHESVAGGAWNAIARGRADGCEAVQIFARPAQQWRARPLPPDEVSMFRSEHATVGWPAMSHASYLINLCAGDPVILDKSRDALVGRDAAAPRSWASTSWSCTRARTSAPAREDGIDAAAASLSEVHDRTRGLRVRLLLEITAGQGSCLGCRFDEMAAMLDRARGGDTHGHLLRHLPRPRRRASTSAPRRATSAPSTTSRARSASTGCAPSTSTTRRRRPAAASTATPRSATATWACCRSGGWSTTPRFATVPGVLETPSGPDKLPSFARNLARLRALIGAPRPPGPPKSQALPDKIDPRQGRLFAD